MAQKPSAAPPLLVRTRRSDHRLDSGTEYRVGRDPAAEIVLTDPRVSWHHAVLKTDGRQWVLEDTSTNGTFLGTERADRVDIRTNCIVRLGNPEDGPVLRFEPQLPPEPAAPAPPAPPEPVPSWAPEPARPPRGPGGAPDDVGENLAALPSVDRRPTARLPLPAKILRIGRAPDNDLVIADLGVTRRHAELRKSPSGRYQIIDLGSHNGTYVNGARVDRAELSENDIVSVGHATFRLADGELREYVDEGNVSFEARDLVVRVSGNGKPKVLLAGITFALPERAFLAVIGPAGAGKTTLLNALTGKRPADQGSVLYDKRDLYKSYEELRHRIGLVPQLSCTHDQLTARLALGYAAELRFPPDTGRSERRQRVEEVLGELEMSQHGDTRVERLSGGQNKRVNIGLELLTRPSLLFLDEPTSPLDPHLKRELMERMRKMADGAAEKGQSVVVITHDVESKLLDLADRLLVLAPGGKMAYFGPPADGLKYFGKSDWADVFKDFSDQPLRDWTAEYQASKDYARYVAGPMTERAPRPLPPDSPQREEQPPPPRKRGRVSQLSTLSRRYARVMSVDRGYLMFTALLPLILGVLVRVTSGTSLTGSLTHPNVNTEQTLLILVIGAVLSGMANSVREIIKERDIFERERMAGLSVGAYLFSKVLVLGLVSLIQSVIIVIIGLAGKQLPAHGSVLGSALIEMLVAVAALTLVSMLVGLTVSTLVTKSEQTMPVLVVVTMVQVVLSGALFTLKGAASWVSDIAPARWGLGALASTTNLNVINPGGMVHPDALWNHTAAQWGTNMGVLIGIGVICLFVAQWRLRKLGPGRRK